MATQYSIFLKKILYFFNQSFVAGCLALECHSLKDTNILLVNQQILLVFPFVRILSSMRIETSSVLLLDPQNLLVSYNQ